MTVGNVVLKPSLNGILNSPVTMEFQEIKPEKLISIEKDLQNLSVDISGKSENSYKDLHSLIFKMEIYRSFSVFTFTPDIMLAEQIAESIK